MKNHRRKSDVPKPARVLPALVDFIGRAAALLTGHKLREETRAIARRDANFALAKETHFAAPMWRYVGHDRGKKYDGKMLRALRALKGVGSVRKLRA